MVEPAGPEKQAAAPPELRLWVSGGTGSALSAQNQAECTSCCFADMTATHSPSSCVQPSAELHRPAMDGPQRINWLHSRCNKQQHRGRGPRWQHLSFDSLQRLGGRARGRRIRPAAARPPPGHAQQAASR